MQGHLKIGIIGISEGNGHPFSWSAIFNGYDDFFMKNCPYPIIYEYLRQQKFPDAQIPDATVTHIWTQDYNLSKQIARSSNIENICVDFKDMISHIDAVLIARDDSENHEMFAIPFLEAGLPVYIDKPIATSISNFNNLLSLQKYDWQIFSCSALRYANEFAITTNELDNLGGIVMMEAKVPKSWERYAIHAIEPICSILNIVEEDYINTSVVRNNRVTHVTTLLKSDIILSVTSLGDVPSGISIDIICQRGIKKMIFKDSFLAFKAALVQFIAGIRGKRIVIPREQTASIVNLISKGING